MKQIEQPYERFMEYGAGSLTNAELLAIILRTGTSGTTAVELGRQILELNNSDSTSLISLHNLTMSDLLSVHGIGEVKAIKILCLAEITRRMVIEKKKKLPTFTNPSDIAACYMEELRHKKKEVVLLLMLDTKLSLIGEKILTEGTVNSSILSPRDVFTEAMHERAVSIILLHNHPSGDPTPSAEDVHITRQISIVGTLMDIKLLDHIIIGDLCYTSLKEAGYLSDEKREKRIFETIRE